MTIKRALIIGSGIAGPATALAFAKAGVEAEIFEKLLDATRGCTTVLISHRFSTVRMADLIVVLDGSRVAESGTHEQLMANGGPYAELYEIQASAYR